MSLSTPDGASLPPQHVPADEGDALWFLGGLFLVKATFGIEILGPPPAELNR